MIPSTEQVRDWIDVPVSEISDAQLEQAIEAELQLQSSVCRFPESDVEYPEFLAQALYRRVARAVAARGVPLGTPILGSEYGSGPIPSYDGEIERLEAPARKWVFS